MPAPITVYGRAKADAERRVRAAHPAATIVRLPLLYRIDPPDRALAAWLADARAGRGYALFVDEIRRPAHVADVAQALVLVAAASLRLAGAGDHAVPPVVHLPGPVALSRHAFGVGVLEALGLPVALAVAGRSADGGTPRPRVLDLVAVRTPAAFLAPLRSPAEVFIAVRRETPPAGRPGAR
jgi:dTDP-4-dehydrorhamnose reductase